MRTEKDFLGEVEIPDNVYYGVQTMRALENFKITGYTADKEFIISLGIVKKAAALANMEVGLLDATIGKAIVQAADEIIEGKMFTEFPVDPIQGGAGTSFNMNVNEVLANRALEILGRDRGDYAYISPNNHSNMSQSTNDVFPTAIRVCTIRRGKKLIKSLKELADELEKKGSEFKNVLKIGRTHLQDAVPITLGEEFFAYASSVRRAKKRVDRTMTFLHEVNMGATAVGTGLNADPEYIKAVARHLSNLTGEDFKTASNLVDATNNTDVFADVSGSLKVTALALIKIANDLRLMASGPRAGLHEICLPARQPGSSIMPGKVNPVIPEVVNQTCYQVIANDLAVTMGVENGQFELNVMEPVIAFNIFNSLRFLTNAIDTFKNLCIKDIKANEAMCQAWLDKSVGIVTALLPHIGYEQCSALAKEALANERGIKDLVLEKNIITAEDLNVILSPKEMTEPGIAGKSLLCKRCI
ncbi:aspartate ammonia-lyase [Succinispira mobilis]|uniref:aspartate ammonia-lyase n=1 Tax=Succinispira mobilis TaxID=78120 RepID=UPI00035D0B5A|nr:aspartate ammonia-lyase [Succinispira mobilis]